jgi:hypothetical protein
VNLSPNGRRKKRNGRHTQREDLGRGVIVPVMPESETNTRWMAQGNLSQF